jgi:isoleucyl-tRNA synthetase
MPKESFVKDADPLVLKDLDAKSGLLFEGAQSSSMSYPHCWRCDTPLIYYARESWFIKMTDVQRRSDPPITTPSTGFPKTIGQGSFR